ncbi:MAG: GMP synthase [Gammaproteobacteria bacterium]|nr:GMP synthase [Gammaproteobacteria bacterium]
MDQFQSRFGDYPEMFVKMLAGAAELRPQFSTFDARDIEYPPADACDAYIITGSRHSVYDDDPWIRPLVDFVGAALAAQRRVVGICFGHQLIAHYFGGRTEPAAAGWGVGVHNVQFIGAESWMQPAQSEVGLLSSHKDQVVELPLNARVIARSDFCPNSGYVIGDQVLTLQGHPEFSKSYVDELMRARQQLLGEQTFQAGIASLREETHEALVARWILNFMDRP